VYTHCPRDERFDGDGRFADEQARVKEILSHDVRGAMVLLNETYSTTNEALALEVTSELAEKLFGLGAFGLYITHQHGLESTRIPFLSVIVDQADANRRTYKIERRRGASDSFAMDILKKYGLTAEKLRERFAARERGEQA
jgi:DNA mismatch repair ATPase MutS